MTRKPTPEELALGLDPEKYSKEAFNPPKFEGLLAKNDNPLDAEVTRMRQLTEEHRKLLGSDESHRDPSPEERAKIREEMMRRMKGL